MAHKIFAVSESNSSISQCGNTSLFRKKTKEFSFRILIDKEVEFPIYVYLVVKELDGKGRLHVDRKIAVPEAFYLYGGRYGDCNGKIAIGSDASNGSRYLEIHRESGKTKLEEAYAASYEIIENKETGKSEIKVYEGAEFEVVKECPE